MAKPMPAPKEALIVLISLLLAFLAAAICADSYLAHAEQCPEQAHVLTLHNIPERRQGETLDALLDFAYANGSLVVRSGYDLLPDGSSDGIRMGVAGVAEADDPELQLTFMGQVLIDGSSLATLMPAESQGATRGLGVSSTDMLGEPLLRLRPEARGHEVGRAHYEDVVVNVLPVGERQRVALALPVSDGPGRRAAAAARPTAVGESWRSLCDGPCLRRMGPRD